MDTKITCPYCNTEQEMIFYPSDLRFEQLHKVCSKCKEIFKIEIEIEIEIAFTPRGKNEV